MRKTNRILWLQDAASVAASDSPVKAAPADHPQISSSIDPEQRAQNRSAIKLLAGHLGKHWCDHYIFCLLIKLCFLFSLDFFTHRRRLFLKKIS